MNRRSVSRSAVLCLSMLIASALAGSAQQVQPLEPEWLRQMYEQGWQKVQEGVLQRDTGGGQPETFTYGAEGMQWVAQHLRQQASVLESKYNAFPDEDLADVIDELKGESLRLEGGLDTAPSAQGFDGEALQNCTMSYGGNAFAGPQSGVRGVAASASAYFHNDCGYVGNTAATAYAHAIAGTVETTKTQNDPKNGGAWIDSNASASANGSTDCYSWAQGTSEIPALGIYYLTPLRENYLCPIPLTNSVSGYSDYYTHSKVPCADVIWTASASGGTPGYTYDWYIDGVYQGSGSTLTRQYCSQSVTVTARAVARDSAGQTAEATYTTTITYYSGSGTGGSCPPGSDCPQDPGALHG